jgi:hypothetical protein
MFVLRWEDFEELVLRNPEVGIKTIRLLSERLAVCEGRLSDQIRKEVIARLAGLILSLSEQEGAITANGSHRIPTRPLHPPAASGHGGVQQGGGHEGFGEVEQSGRRGDQGPTHPCYGCGRIEALR